MNKVRGFSIHNVRPWLTRNFTIVRLTAAILIGVLFAVVIIFLISDDAGAAISKLFTGALQSKRRFGNVIELMIPLTFAGLSVSVMFKANQFNIGTEGTFYAGGAVAAMIALCVPLPPFIHPLTAILAGGFVGGLICLLVAALKVKWGTSELVTSLMLNYVVYYLFKYIMFTGSGLKDPNSGYISTYKMPEDATLGLMFTGTRIHYGLILMVLAVVLVSIYMHRTKWGYALKLTGENMTFAKYSGISVSGVILASQFIGGLIGGVGGAVQVLGMYERFQWSSLPGYGFDGIIVAILARKNPIFIPVAAFFLAYLRIGSDAMSSSTSVTNEIISIIQSIIILFVSAQVFLDSYRQRMVVREVVDRNE